MNLYNFPTSESKCMSAYENDVN